MSLARKYVVFTIGILYCAILSVSVSYAQSGYRLVSSSVSAGSGRQASGSYQLRGILQGILVPCQSQSASFIMKPADLTICNGTVPTTITPIATTTPTTTNTPAKPTVAITATPTATVIEPPKGIGDIYESDDICQNARLITPDGTSQSHTFHKPSDTDWIHFDAKKGETYLIEGRVASESEVDLVVELYKSCSSGAQQAQNYSFSSDIRVQFTVTVNSTIYLRLLNDKLAGESEEQSYQLSIRSLSAASLPGALIIVAGRIKGNDPLQSNIYALANRAWRLWRSHGYPAERIRYLASDLTLDANEDGTSDIYALPSRANLRASVAEWSKGQISTDRPLTIYLVDHGDPDLFYLDKQRSEFLHPQELDEWLDSLEAAVPGVKITLIVEACYSGSFIQKANSVSGVNRVVITSTDADTPAWASKQGAYFSDSFFDALTQGHTLYAAFQEGQDFARRFNPNQRAWLDDNGDAITSEEDGSIATQRSFANVGTLDTERWPPYIPAEEVRDIGNNRYEIWVRALDDVGIQAVWAQVYPPSYQPPTSSEELVSGPVPISLQARGEDWYAALYGQFEEIGEYRIVIYAEDILGLHSRPREIFLKTGQQTFLPLVMR